MKIFTDRQLRKPSRPQVAPAPPPRQCEAITLAGSRCRLDARGGTPYCLLHRGYQPPVTPATP